MYRVIKTLKNDHPEPVDCQVTGKIPQWLKGSLYRNGPGIFEFGSDTHDHLFSGASVLHRYRFGDGEVTYQCRIFDSDTYNRNKAANRIVVSDFGTVGFPDPCKSIFSRYFSYLFDHTMSDNTAVNVLAMEDQLYALTESCFLHRVDPETLTSLEKVDLHNIVAVNQATAHPITDYDGCVYNLGLTFSKNSFYHVIKTSPPSKGDANPMSKSEILGKIPAAIGHKPSYFHSFAMSENYIIVTEIPVHFNIFHLVIGKWPRWSYKDCLKFDPQIKTKFHLMDKKTGQLHPVKYECDALFTFHHVNAFEQDGHVVVDLCGYEDMKIIYDFDLKNLWCDPASPEYKGLAASNFRRYVLPLKYDKDSQSDKNIVTLESFKAEANLMSDGTVYCTPQCIDTVFDLPRINYDRFNARPYRYVYGADLSHDTFKLIKLDVTTGEQKVFSAKGFILGEPVFIPNPDGSEEDDGVVVSPLMADQPNQSSGLVFLDGKSFTELARGMTPPDVQLCFTFHGVHVPPK